MAAIFFLFLDAQKLPKNPEPLFSVAATASTDGLFARGGRGLPVFGSTCVGLLACWRSLTIAIACILSGSLTKEIGTKRHLHDAR